MCVFVFALPLWIAVMHSTGRNHAQLAENMINDYQLGAHRLFKRSETSKYFTALMTSHVKTSSAKRVKHFVDSHCEVMEILIHLPKRIVFNADRQF